MQPPLTGLTGDANPDTAALSALPADPATVVRPAPPRRVPAYLKPLQDQFEFLELLGDGGMGQVWRVHNVLFDDECAVKVIRPELADDQQLLERMVREARAMARLKHPHAVAVRGASVKDVAYIEMEYLCGKTLDKLLEPGVPMPLEWTAQFLDQLCDVLEMAHANKIIHRDLKPSNLMLVDGGCRGEVNLKVLDFGIAKFLNPAPDAFQTIGSVPCTPMYMSPEQAKDEPQFSARSDIFSIGLILYELLTGRHPFYVPGRTRFSLMIAISSERTPRFQDRNPAVRVSEEIEKLVLRCLEKDPDRRPSSAAALAQEFRRLVPAPAPAFPSEIAAPPKPGRPVGTTWPHRLWFLAPLVFGAVLGSLGVRWSVTPSPPVSPARPPEVVRLPRYWIRAPETELVKIDEKYYPRQIQRDVPGVPGGVVALLIERRAAKPAAAQPDPFYIMKDKVWAGLFEAFAREHTEAVPDSRWRDDRDPDPRLPVRNVTGLEAQAFAAWLGGPGHGFLPTPAQWDQAAGMNLANGPPGPFREPWDPKDRTEIAVGVPAPIAVRMASRDISPYGCRDMSGNGWEWTRPDPGASPTDDVDLRAQRFDAKEPFRFDDIKNKPACAPFDHCDRQTGFRVVIELEGSG
jgi:serine/threonine protein kinase